MSPPQGTFLAHVRSGHVQLPPPMVRFCAWAEWNFFRITPLDDERLELTPVLPGNDAEDVDEGYHASLSNDGKLWVPSEVRDVVTLGDQAVMMRIEDGVIRMYLRRVFKTLGFGP